MDHGNAEEFDDKACGDKARDLDIRVSVGKDINNVQNGDIIVLNPSCANEYPDGHVGQVVGKDTSTNTVYVCERNFDGNGSERGCDGEGYPYKLSECMSFIHKPSNPGLDNSFCEQEHGAVPPVVVPATTTYTPAYDNDLQKWFCETLKWGCPQPQPVP